MINVSEIFESIQGEGIHSGSLAMFVRLHGCSVRCKWCDTPSPKPKMMSETDIAGTCSKSKAQMIVFTGGEPTEQPLEDLSRKLAETGKLLCLETAGTCNNSFRWFNWITLSPKLRRPPTPEIVKIADEIKIVVDSPLTIKKIEEIIMPINATTPRVLQPEWGMRQDQEIIRTMLDAVRLNPRLYRIGMQIHKLINVP